MGGLGSYFYYSRIMVCLFAVEERILASFCLAAELGCNATIGSHNWGWAWENIIYPSFSNQRVNTACIRGILIKLEKDRNLW